VQTRLRLRTAASLLLSGVILACFGHLGEHTSYADSPARGRSTPRDRYEAAAAKGSLFEAWQSAGRRALRERLSIRPSFRELVFFDANSPTAVAYRLELRRGQRVALEYQPVDGRVRSVFAEVFEEVNPPGDMFVHRHSSDPAARRLDFEATNDGTLVFRLQPPPGTSGLLEVILNAQAALTFPVLAGSLKSVESWFGDARDGGARDHEGIDIFAPRGTAVVAVADGLISEVESTSLGGRVVWQRDERRGVLYYYAHLERQFVAEGQRVKAGDRIGAVGNSGNASRASPHLHFGVYRTATSPIDPAPFLYNQPGDSIVAVVADASMLGSWARIQGDSIGLRSAPSEDARTIVTLPAASAVRLVSGVRDWLRVSLEDGTSGFLPATRVVTERGR
jgi:murein DD-endopeptidase MepM/ murein hydrolase activator NlpD